jgi:leader peptidase (prepilin peptidase)/N-methyltransferase
MAQQLARRSATCGQPFATAQRRAVSVLLISVLVLAGLVAAPGQRMIISRMAVDGHTGCPVCRDRAMRTWRASWRLAAGRCAACQRLAWPPPLSVEITTALLLAALAARVHPGVVLAAACWLALCAVPLAFIDVAVRRLPDLLTGLAWAGTALLLLLAAASGGQWGSLVRAIIGGAALAGFYLLLLIVSPSGMGLGDVKAAASIGTLLAWAGWRVLLAGSFAGFLLAALYGGALLISGRASRKQQIPFGPFMLAGAFLAVLAWP